MAQPDGQHSPRPGRPEAAAVVWDWRAPDDAPDRAAAARKAGVIRALVAAGAHVDEKGVESVRGSCCTAVAPLSPYRFLRC